MKTNYVAPQIEVIEIEVESVLCESFGSTTPGGTTGNR